MRDLIRVSLAVVLRLSWPTPQTIRSPDSPDLLEHLESSALLFYCVLAAGSHRVLLRCIESPGTDPELRCARERKKKEREETRVPQGQGNESAARYFYTLRRERAVHCALPG